MSVSPFHKACILRKMPIGEIHPLDQFAKALDIRGGLAAALVQSGRFCPSAHGSHLGGGIRHMDRPWEVSVGWKRNFTGQGPIQCTWGVF